MADKVSLYTLDGLETEDSAFQVKPGDLAMEEVTQAGRIELPNGHRMNAEAAAKWAGMSKAEQRAARRANRQLTKKTKEQRKPPVYHKAMKARTTAELWAGAAQVGAHIGYFEENSSTRKGAKRENIYSAGPVQIGADGFIIGVIPYHKRIFLGRGGVILLVSQGGRGANPSLKHAPVDPTDLTDGEKQLWGDAICRQFVDLYTTSKIGDSIGAMGARYRQVVKALVEGAIVDCAAVGIERTVADFAYAVDRTWTTKDLLNPIPNIKHAVYVSLALGLEPDQAVMLIEYAAWMELQLGVFQRETALSLYAEARRQFAILCPQWQMHHKYTAWRQIETSVAELMKLHCVRHVNDALARGLPLEAVLGLRLSLTQLGSSPLAGSYIDRSMKYEIGMEAINTLRRVRIGADQDGPGSDSHESD